MEQCISVSCVTLKHIWISASHQYAKTRCVLHYHVSSGVVDTLLQTLERHPLDWQLGLAVVTAVVVAFIDVSRQTEVGHFDTHLVVQPTPHQQYMHTSHPTSDKPTTFKHDGVCLSPSFSTSETRPQSGDMK